MALLRYTGVIEQSPGVGFSPPILVVTPGNGSFQEVSNKIPSLPFSIFSVSLYPTACADPALSRLGTCEPSPLPLFSASSLFSHAPADFSPASSPLSFPHYRLPRLRCRQIATQRSSQPGKASTRAARGRARPSGVRFGVAGAAVDVARPAIPFVLGGEIDPAVGGAQAHKNHLMP